MSRLFTYLPIPHVGPPAKEIVRMVMYNISQHLGIFRSTHNDKSIQDRVCSMLQWPTSLLVIVKGEDYRRHEQLEEG